MAISITQDVKSSVEIIFYVKEGENSPYQGRLVYTPEEYAAMTPADLEAAQSAQFAAWKAATLAANCADCAAAIVANAVPDSITAAQARRALTNAGLKETVEAAVAGSDQAAQDLWYTSENIERQNPTLLALAASIGLTDAQLDDLFRAGALL